MVMMMDIFMLVMDIGDGNDVGDRDGDGNDVGDGNGIGDGDGHIDGHIDGNGIGDGYW